MLTQEWGRLSQQATDREEGWRQRFNEASEKYLDLLNSFQLLDQRLTTVQTSNLAQGPLPQLPEPAQPVQLVLNLSVPPSELQDPIDLSREELSPHPSPEAHAHEEVPSQETPPDHTDSPSSSSPPSSRGHSQGQGIPPLSYSPMTAGSPQPSGGIVTSLPPLASPLPLNDPSAMWTFFEAQADSSPLPSYQFLHSVYQSTAPLFSAFQAELSSQLTRVATLETELENAKLSEGNLEQMQLAINRLEEVEARCTSLVAQVQHANASLDHLSNLFTSFSLRLQVGS